MRAALLLPFVVVAAVRCGSAAECKSDSDCKGERVCESGACRDPRGALQTSDASSAAASTTAQASTSGGAATNGAQSSTGGMSSAAASAASSPSSAAASAAAALASSATGPGWVIVDSPRPQDTKKGLGGTTNLWITGEAGLLLRYDGSAFTTLATGTFEQLGDIWVSAPDDVWIVGDPTAERLLHWNGTAMSEVPAPSYTQDPWPYPHIFHGSSPSNVWAGNGHSLARWDGSSWASVSLPYQSDPIGGLYTFGPSDTWVCFQQTSHWDGTGWTNLTPSIGGVSRCYGLYAASSTDVFVVMETDTNTAVLRYQNGVWSISHTFGTNALGLAVVGTSANDVWVLLRDNEFAHFDGTSWTSYDFFGAEAAWLLNGKLWALLGNSLAYFNP